MGSPATWPCRHAVYDARHQRGVVVLAAVAAARHRGVVDLLAQLAILQLGQRRLAGGIEQRDDVLAVELACLGGFGGSGNLLLRQTIQLLDVVHDHSGSIHFGQHVLAESGAQVGQLGIHSLERGLVGVGELGAVAHEVAVVLLDQAHALRIQPQLGALVVQGLDACEQLAVERNRIAVRCELRRIVGLQFLACVVGVCADQVEEHRGGAVERGTALFQRDDGVVETGLGLLAGDFSTSFNCSAMPASKAGAKSLSLILSNCG